MTCRFGRLAKGGTRIAYLKFSSRKSLLNLLKTLQSNPEMIASPSDSRNPQVRSPVLEEHLNACHGIYTTSHQDLRKTAEDSLVKFNDELNVCIRIYLSFFILYSHIDYDDNVVGNS